VMTLHRAKGLEFDTVILPGLARATIRGAPGLLRWRMRPQGLLLAPAKVRGGREDPMYGYLGMLDADEEDAELARLLYVGCTRARTRLHLTASLPVVESDGALAWKAPPTGSALSKLWNALDIAPPPRDAGAAAAERTAMPPLLARLPLAFQPVDPAGSVPLATEAFAHERAVREFAWAHITTAAVGTVAHRLLAQVGGEGLVAWNAERVAASRARIERELASEGVAAAAVPAAIDGVIAVVTRVLADARGRWLFDPAHDDAASERALAGQDEGGLVHVTLDRTFVASGVRWIVDFKTGRHEGGNIGVFLDSEVERYRGQLERYARIMCALDARSRTVRVALYYPLVEGGWREWDVAC